MHIFSTCNIIGITCVSTVVPGYFHLNFWCGKAIVQYQLKYLCPQETFVYVVLLVLSLGFVIIMIDGYITYFFGIALRQVLLDA